MSRVSFIAVGLLADCLRLRLTLRYICPQIFLIGSFCLVVYFFDIQNNIVSVFVCIHTSIAFLLMCEHAEWYTKAVWGNQRQSLPKVSIC